MGEYAINCRIGTPNQNIYLMVDTCTKVIFPFINNKYDSIYGYQARNVGLAQILNLLQRLQHLIKNPQFI